MCHGSLRMLAVPPVQLSFFIRTLETAPIRSTLTILGMVLECSEPSRVTGHLTVRVPLNSRLLHLAFINCSLTERFLADAVPSALASSRAAMSAVRPSFAEVRIYCLSCGVRRMAWRTVTVTRGGVAIAVTARVEAGEGLGCKLVC